MPSRRGFLQQAAVSTAASKAGLGQTSAGGSGNGIAYPRVFSGAQTAMIAFPLGGVAAGSVSLGGRGQLRDWEIFNKPDKGRSLAYAFPSIWVTDGAKNVVRVLEARFLPPYEGQNGLGSRNAPGLTRLSSARFTGEYPFAHVEFQDRTLPVRVSLEAFSPFIPHEEDDSGLPVAILRYRVSNPGTRPATASIAWSIENPVIPDERPPTSAESDGRRNEFRTQAGLAGFSMTNPQLAATDPMHGSFALALVGSAEGRVSHLTGWPKGRWWNSPLLFWDDFSKDGQLGPETGDRNAVAALCLSRTILPNESVDFTYLLAWHFPNRTPRRCGWNSSKGDEEAPLGNWYTTRFADAWEAASYAADNLERLEKKTRQFAAALRDSTLPGAVKDAATANLSTLASTTCFRTADGEFHGFEGSNDKKGCCHGNCTHVWNYETSTPFLFPKFARSLRKAAFGYSMDEAGAMRFRQTLPDGKERWKYTAADGQMGQIVHAYLDYKLSGDAAWLRGLWPRLKRAIEFAWVPGGWDADRDGVMEGVQHNTYDVEFYGPNPQCGVYYLAGLRASEEMARAVGDSAAATEYRRLFERGRDWIDANLFNGEYYIQKVRGAKPDQIAPTIRSDFGSEETMDPQYQVGAGCLVDQLIGQYLADASGLGPLLDPRHIRQTLASIYKYNFKRSLEEHDSVQRIFAVNDEAALIVCDYAKAPRPQIPFPYYAEVFTGLEYSTAAQLIWAGLLRGGIECVDAVRRRHDGERRNPYNEPECGHHYVRAMSAWSPLLALAGFQYDGSRQSVLIAPAAPGRDFRSVWSTAEGWGLFNRQEAAGKTSFRVRVDHGQLRAQVLELLTPGTKVSASAAGKGIDVRAERRDSRLLVRFDAPVTITEGSELQIGVSA